MYSESEIQKVIETYGDVTCIHRHRWPDHKSCFARGLIKIKNGGERLDAKQFEKKDRYSLVQGSRHSGRLF